MRFCIPKTLQSHFKRKQFKISLKSGNYKDSKRLSLYLNDVIKEIYQDIRMGKKKLTIEEVKSILKIEVDKSVLHIQHIETGTGTTENQVLKSLQHITKEETQFKRTLEDDRKKVEDKVDMEMSKIIKSLGYEVDKKSLEFKTLRKRVIELKLLRYKYKKDFVSGGVFNTNINGKSLNSFIEECNRTFNLDMLDEKVEEKLPPVIENFSIEPEKLYKVEVNEKVETILISKLIEDYLEETQRQKGLREKTIVEYRSVLLILIEVIGDLPINELSQKHGRLFSSSLEKLPPRRKTDGRYKNKSIKEIVQMDVKMTMDTRTINTLIQRCSSWLNWVIRKGYYEDKNIFHGKSIPSKKGKDVITRQPFNEEQLNLIFCKDYLNKTLNSSSPCRYVFYWVGILGLFHGTRLQETTQLHINDIYPLDKLWVIDINDNTTDKKLKTKTSNRVIPLHQTLIDVRVSWIITTYLKRVVNKEYSTN